jgi:hypothetical protein
MLTLCQKWNAYVEAGKHGENQSGYHISNSTLRMVRLAHYSCVCEIGNEYEES